MCAYSCTDPCAHNMSTGSCWRLARPTLACSSPGLACSHHRSGGPSCSSTHAPYFQVLAEHSALTQYAILVSYPWALFFQTLSVNMTVCVSVHRYIGVCHPFRMRRWGTSQRVRTVIVACAVCALVFNAPRAFEVYIAQCVTVDGYIAVRVQSHALSEVRMLPWRATQTYAGCRTTKSGTASSRICSSCSSYRSVY
jgi:hypothetical protein